MAESACASQWWRFNLGLPSTSAIESVADHLWDRRLKGKIAVIAYLKTVAKHRALYEARREKTKRRLLDKLKEASEMATPPTEAISDARLELLRLIQYAMTLSEAERRILHDILIDRDNDDKNGKRRLRRKLRKV